MTGIEYIVPPIMIGFFLIVTASLATLFCCLVWRQKKLQAAGVPTSTFPTTAPLTATGTNFATMTTQQGASVVVPVPETNLMQYGQDRATITTPQGITMDVPLPADRKLQETLVNMLRQQGHEVQLTTASGFEPVSQ